MIFVRSFIAGVLFSLALLSLPVLVAHFLSGLFLAFHSLKQGALSYEAAAIAGATMAVFSGFKVAKAVSAIKASVGFKTD